MGMATINYRFHDGHYETLEVTEEIADTFKECNREDWRLRKRQQKYETKISLSQMTEDCGFDVPDNNLSPEDQTIDQEERDKLYRTLKQSISCLLPPQRLLLRQIYIENRSLKQIAEETGVSYQAIQNRLKKIFEKLRKFFD